MTVKQENKISEENLNNLMKWFTEGERKRLEGLIQFYKKIEGLRDYEYGERVEKIVESRTTRHIQTFVESPKDLINTIKTLGVGIVNVENRLYEVEGKGAILYSKVNILKTYFAGVRLIGFDSRDSFYTNLKHDLEEISSQGDLKEIKSRNNHFKKI